MKLKHDPLAMTNTPPVWDGLATIDPAPPVTERRSCGPVCKRLPHHKGGHRRTLTRREARLATEAVAA